MREVISVVDKLGRKTARRGDSRLWRWEACTGI